MNRAYVPVPRTSANPEQKTRMKALDESVTWLRKHNPNASHLDHPTALAISNLAGKAIPKDASTREARNTDERTIMAFDLPSGNRSTRESCRPKKLDDASVQAFCECSRIPIPNGSLSPSAKEALVNEVVSWLRKNGRRLPPIEDPSDLKTCCRCCTRLQSATLQISKSLSAPDENPAKQLVNWLRDNTFNPADLDDLVVQALADLTSSDLPKGSFAPDDWIRTYDHSPEELERCFVHRH
jgi:hypothetical protein